MQSRWAAVCRKVHTPRGETRATAAIEFAGTAALLSVGLLNAVGVGDCMYQRRMPPRWPRRRPGKPDPMSRSL